MPNDYNQEAEELMTQNRRSAVRVSQRPEQGQTADQCRTQE